MTNNDKDRSSWAVAGGLILGTGVGFFFLRQSGLAFIGSMFVGLGSGLLIAAIISSIKGRK